MHDDLDRLDAHLATYPDRAPELIYDEPFVSSALRHEPPPTELPDIRPRRRMAGRPGPRRRRALRRQSRATSGPRNREG
mgnify:CR=1 FL=1